MQLQALADDAELDLTLLVPPPDGEQVVVRWVHTSDIVDPRPWLEGGELLLTTGAGLLASPQGTSAYVRRLRDAGVAALGFGVRPYHREAPAALRRACARWGLPLLEVPGSTPFIAVSRTVGRWWSEQQNRELGEAISAQRRLARAALHPSPLAALVDRLAAELGCWVVVRRPDGDTVAGRVPEEVRVRVAALTDGGTGATGSTEVAGESVLVRRLPGGSDATLVVGRSSRLSSMERAVLLVAEDLLAVTTSDDRRPVDRDAVGEVVLRAFEDGDVDLGGQLARALGASPRPGEPWRVVVARGRHPAPSELSTRLVRHRGVIAHGGPTTWTVLTAEGSLQPVLDELVAAGWSCGHSGPAPDGRLPRAFVEARAALGVATRTGPGARVVGPGDVRGPLSTVTAEQTEAARLHLEPLLADPRAELLVGTVRTWLDAHGHWDRAAQALGVHRHTVKSRVGQVFELLGISPESARDRFELWFALQAVDPAPDG
ncbi:PucR family transcriptional regulator [Nocardioides caldifontis]|uniref:PucR family transcriptional regulator n=1 Tax=Nocardioides caldifontis TaxID=2588938 RepID=UPI0011DF814B|nr:PucR family transcriptional regulator [Nocardioides caldifontis]